VEVADETPEPADPQAASETTARSRRMRTEITVMAFTAS
jgi:hypothetical protein